MNRAKTLCLGFLLSLYLSATGSRSLSADEGMEFFEARIRPVLVEQCYACHNSATLAEGGLAVDAKQPLLQGGDRGPILVPGRAGESRLLAILRHETPGLKMPQGGAKLDQRVIADFEKWIAMGAPDPRDKPPSADELAKETSWESVRDRRQRWWSFQPVRRAAPPNVKTPDWSEHPVDRFVLAKLEEHGLPPSPPADKRTLLRRVTFTLTGLPPTAEEISAFVADDAPDAYGRLIDRLLDSPRFGERWARHWMDLVRYCESHGSQGDPELPNAWRYRDYLIRAFNQDVPYDQLVREHLAGDLLPQPRVHPTEGWNESILATAHLRMGEYGYLPVDALDDQVKVVDNQIDVFSKAFLGLTVSCARCHDHKFDPISQADFYALYGVFASCRPGQVSIERPERLEKNRNELARGKARIRAGLAEAWQAAVPRLVRRMQEQEERDRQLDAWQRRARELEVAIAAVERPAIEQLSEARGGTKGESLPRPVARWSFSGDAKDSAGSLHGELQGNAKVRDGRLVLDGQGAFVRTPPLSRNIGEKTLEAWVSLAQLDQRGGGVITLESKDGTVFDSLVFSELEPRVWLAGSNFHQRTQHPGGPPEQAPPDRFTHLAVVYRADHSITLYRNGEPYGSSWTKGTLQKFAAGEARLLLGQRHTGGGNPFLAGEIDEARLYDRPLTPAEVAASFRAGPAGFTRKELLQALPAEPARRLQELYDEQQSLLARLQPVDDADPWRAPLADARTNAANPLHAWTTLATLPGERIAATWHQLAQAIQSDLEARRAENATQFQPGWDLTGKDAAQWFAAGSGLSDRSSTEGLASAGGEFSIEREGERLLGGIYPAGVFTHRLSRTHSGVLTSPRFVIATDSVSIRALGEQATVRLVIENYPLGNGGIFPATRLARDDMGWVRLDAAYRRGAQAYVEFVTDDSDRAGYGASQVVFHNTATPPREVVIPTRHLYEATLPTSASALAAVYAERLQSAIAAFRAGSMTDDEVAFLDYFVRAGLLPVSLAELPELRDPLEEYRRLEREIPRSRRSPGVYEAQAFDQPLFVRGRHTQPAAPVPRRFLEVLGGKGYDGPQSGRLQLAAEVASPDNPLTARVLVNRLWQHVFGRGIVGTVDNFGRLGDQPTHPELLDYLASRFVNDEQWSIKSMLRLMLTSRTYQQASLPGSEAEQRDGNNAWLSHMRVRRLEAEAIRDAILSAAEQLDPTPYGPGVNVYFVSKTEGGGPKGPLDGDRRRSIYQRIRRNAHNPFLEVFDAPKPATTRGRRDVTNVPAQSLTMLNDPFVIELASRWARMLVGEGAPADLRIRRMFVATLGREPESSELEAGMNYLNDLADEHGVPRIALGDSLAVWQDFAQSLFCLKEFVYVR
ncbi:MAG: DUF1553 domain-containing protein [Planctomycetales bacterium]